MASTVLDPGFHAGQPVDSQQAFQADDSQIYTSHPHFPPQVLSFISTTIVTTISQCLGLPFGPVPLPLFSVCINITIILLVHPLKIMVSFFLLLPPTLDHLPDLALFLSVTSFISPLSVPLCIHVLFSAQTMVIVFQLFS